jgi:hypothetical protein
VPSNSKVSLIDLGPNGDSEVSGCAPSDALECNDSDKDNGFIW